MMKTIAYIFIVVAAVSLIVGLVSRLTLTPVSIVPGGATARSFLEFTNTCLLIAVTFILLHIVKIKQ